MMGPETLDVMFLMISIFDRWQFSEPVFYFSSCVSRTRNVL